MDILRDSQLLIFSPSIIFITFSFKIKSCRFSLQTLAKFEVAKIGRGRWIFAFDRCEDGPYMAVLKERLSFN